MRSVGIAGGQGQNIRGRSLGPKNSAASSRRIRLLLATSSVSALLVAGGTPAMANSCPTPFNITTIVVNTSIVNSGAIACINIASSAVIEGNVINSGHITAISETGITINNSAVTGTVSNSGVISATRTGILVESSANVAGGISNSGTISANLGVGIVIETTATFSGGITNANGGTISGGIAVQDIGLFAGNISNSGTIAGNLTNVDNGIAVRDIATFAGGISNSGTISSAVVGVNVTSLSTFAGGISNSGTISGSDAISVGSIVQFGSSSAGGGISNSGMITAGSTAIRIRNVTSFAGGIGNSGTIAANNIGIAIGSDATFAGGISNSGTISISGGMGIEVAGVATFTGGIANSRQILASNAGIMLLQDTNFTGGITNSGTISVVGEAIDLSGVASFSGGITNSGTLSGIHDIFISVGTSFSGGISNSGKITAITAASADAILVNISSFTGGITNSGTITAIGGDAVAVGGVTNFAGGISNSATVSGRFAGIQVGFQTHSTVFGVSSFAGGISNGGIVSAAAGTGIVVEYVTLFSGGISNSGTISGTVRGLSIFSAVQFGGGSAGGGVTNSGTISAGAAGIAVSRVSTFAGTISNTGSIIGNVGILASGSGPVSVFDSGTLDGVGGRAVDFSGNAAGNTFTLGPGYSITGKVLGQGNDTFQLGGTGSGSFDLSTIGTTQQYEGFTSFNVVGGTWIASGAFGQSQAWNVNGGTLAGTGIFSSLNINSGGTLEPGTPGVAGGKLTVNGNLVFSTAAAYLVNISPSTSSMTVVNGRATPGGTLILNAASGHYVKGTTYDILSATGGLSNTTFSAVDVIGNIGGLKPVVSYDDVIVTLVPTALALPPGAPINQTNAGTTISNANSATSGNLPLGFQNLFNQASSQLLTSLAQLDGEAATDSGKGADQLMNDFLDLLLDPTAGGGGGNIGGGATGFAPEQDTSLPADVALAYAKALNLPLKAPQPHAPQTFDQRWTAWGSGFGGTSFTNGNAAVGSNNVNASDYGFAAGMEYHATPNTTYGFALAGGGTNWNLAQGLGSGRSDAFQAGVYAKTHAGPAYVSAALAFANHWFTTNRIALGDQLRASFTGQSYAARLEGGYRYAVPVTGAIVGVTPYAALQAQDFHTPSYSETDLTGGGFGLSYASMNATDTRSELGARVDNLQIVDGMPLVLRGRLAWAHDWFTNATALNAAFQALPGSSFTVNGAAPPKNSALTTAAAELHITSNWTAIAKFDGEFGSGSQTYGGTGTLKYSW